MGELENDVFEDPKTVFNRDELCINNFKSMDKDGDGFVTKEVILDD